MQRIPPEHFLPQENTYQGSLLSKPHGFSEITRASDTEVREMKADYVIHLPLFV